VRAREVEETCPEDGRDERKSEKPPHVRPVWPKSSAAVTDLAVSAFGRSIGGRREVNR
jgi:hypothetical protein